MPLDLGDGQLGLSLAQADRELLGHAVLALAPVVPPGLLVQALLVPELVRGDGASPQRSVQEDLGPVGVLVEDLLVELPATPVPDVGRVDGVHLRRPVADDELAGLRVQVPRIPGQGGEVLQDGPPEVRRVAFGAEVRELGEVEVQAHLLHLLEAQRDGLSLSVRLVRIALAEAAVLPSPPDDDRHVDDEVVRLVEKLPAVAGVGVLAGCRLEGPQEPTVAAPRLRELLPALSDDPGAASKEVQMLLRLRVTPRL